MASTERQKRPTMAIRRASGSSTRLHALNPLPLSERLNRGEDNSAEIESKRSPSLSATQDISKSIRSSSSNPPAAIFDSKNVSRPQSTRSISGVVETAPMAGTATSTASPLITPADDYLHDPTLAAGKLSLTSSPLLFETYKKGIGPPTSAQQQRDKVTDTEERLGVNQQRRDDLAGGATSTLSTTTKEFRPKTKAWNDTNTTLHWVDTSSLPSSSSSSSPLSTPAAQSMSSLPMSPDLVSLTQSMRMNEAPGTIASTMSATMRLEEAQTEQLHHQQQEPFPYQSHSRQLSHQQQFSHPNTFHQQGQYYTPVDPTHSPELYSSSFQPRANSVLGSVDPTVFETFCSTPDPYAPIYGMPGPASLASSSSPQSPRFSHPSHQGSDSSMFMIPTTYPQGMPNLPGLAHQSGISPQPLFASQFRRPTMTQTGFVSASTMPATHNTMIMQGMSPYPPQSPMLMSMPPSGMNRRDSLSFQQQQPLAAITGGSYSMGNHWNSSPAGSISGSIAGDYMHNHSPSWPGGFEYRSGNGAGHQRVLSGHAPYLPSAMSFLPASISPSSSFNRSTGSIRGRFHSRSASNFSQFSQQRNPQAEVQRSPLLEEFRSRDNKSRRFELEDIRGFLVEFSSDQHGSRFTQEKLDTASEEDMQMVFDELLPVSLNLMTDVFGNYVIQKLFEHGKAEMRIQLMDQMQGHILSLSLGTYGCRVVQKALEYSSNNDQLRVAEELRQDVLTCVRDQNANHVVQKILECISPTLQVDFIPQAFRGRVFGLAAHCYSCRVLQRIFEHCEDSQRRPLIDELLCESEKLIHDQYGNYVIQWILQNGSKPDRDSIINKAKGNVLVLSRHKFASNVLEQVIQAATPNERFAFIEEIMTPMNEITRPGEEIVVGAVVMMKDQYGNYVLQRFLELSLGQQRARLFALIRPALYNMKRYSSGYAKHLTAIERLLEASIPGSDSVGISSKDKDKFKANEG